MSFLKKLEEFVGSKKANVDDLRKASLKSPIKSYSAASESPSQSIEEIEVTPDYEEVIKAINAHDPFIFVSGKAGTMNTTKTRTYSSNIITEGKQYDSALPKKSSKHKTYHALGS